MAAIYMPGSFPPLHFSEVAEQEADLTNATHAPTTTHTHQPHPPIRQHSPHNGIMDHASSTIFTHTPPRSFTAKRKRAHELDSDDRCSSSDAARQPARFSMITNIPQRFWDFSSNVVTGFLDLFRTRQAPDSQLKTTIESVPTNSSGRKRRAVDVTPKSHQTRLLESDAPQMSAFKSPVAAPTPVLPNITEDREKIRARWHREYFGSANVDRMRPKQQQQQPTPTYKPTTHNKSIPFRDRQISGLIAKAHKAQGGSFAQKAAQKAAAEREAAEKAAAEQAAVEEAARIEAEKEAARVRAEEEARARAEEEAARAKEEAARAKAVIVELPEDIVEELQTRMSGNEKDRDTLIQLGSIPIQKISFKRILATDKYGTDSWLDDDAVNAWYNSIVDAKKRKDGYVKSDTNPPTFANLQTAWYEKVSKEGAKGLKRWMKRAGVGGTNILKCERIFLPINMGSHWTLLIINGKDKSIEYLDSMGGGGDKYFKIARELLRSELGDKYEDKAWHNLTRNRSSQQSNMNDCGVFTCLNGLAAAKERSYKEVTAQQMPMARRMMAGVFLNGGFEGALDSVLDV